MEIDLAKLDYAFQARPLLIGGKAMEYYGLRKAGDDIDFVVVRADYEALAQRHPDHLKDLWGDLGVCPFEFEIWTSICLFDYAELSAGAIDQGEYLVISLEKLMLLKALAMDVPKYLADLQLIANKIRTDKYAAWWPTLTPEQQATYNASYQA
jgi:hypothetical protein